MNKKFTNDYLNFLNYICEVYTDKYNKGDVIDNTNAASFYTGMCLGYLRYFEDHLPKAVQNDAEHKEDFRDLEKMTALLITSLAEVLESE